METSEQKNKYYTPTIEEFHIGFECEKKNFINTSNEPYDRLNYITKWEQVVIRPFDAPTKVESKEELSWFRVKYLDIENIESLGWKKLSNKYYTRELPSSYPYHLYAVLDFRWGIEDISIDVVRLVDNRDSNEDQRIFKGTIKNKSELKKLMSQLNILKDEE